MVYDKINEFIEMLIHVFKIVKRMSVEKNSKFKYIAMIIYNYTVKLAKDNNVDLTKINVTNDDKKPINMIPFFEYVSHNDIEFYDFKKIDNYNVDVNKKEDVEKFVLSHIYYITQK
jgi:hypothetical protein